MNKCEFRSELRDGIGYCENPALDEFIERNEKLVQENARLRTQNANLVAAAAEMREKLEINLMLEIVRSNPQKLLMEIADDEVDRIMEMADEEIIAEMLDRGLDPDKEAEKVKNIFKEALDKFRSDQFCDGAWVEG